MQRSNRAGEKPGRWNGALLLAFLLGLPAAASSQAQTHLPPPAAEFVSNSGWPELRVDGKPFYVHAASFDYFRIPPDLWPHCLNRYRDLGINTIDLRIPWNWHEPAPGSYDFSGATNPRRDLRGLLHMIADRGFKLIVRTGPAIGDGWRSGGLPDWLLADSQFNMTASQIADGDEPALEQEFHMDPDTAAVAWLARPNYLGEAREWFAALGVELAPYDSRRNYVPAVPVEAKSQNKNDTGPPKEDGRSGPLLFFILEDGPSLVADADSSNLQKYLALFRDALFSSGVAAPLLIEPANLEVSGATPLSAWFADSTQEHVEGMSGSWSLILQREQNGGRLQEQIPGRQDAESIGMLLGTLGEQPGVPPLITGYQAIPNVAGENDSAIKTAPSSVLLSSRMLLAGGARGITYSPLQDSITPAGYETPGTSRYVNHDSPLDIEGETHPGAVEVGRNGKLIAGWGEWLAGAHVHADFGILDLRAAASGPEWKVARERATEILEREIRTAESAGWAPELIDPALQPADRLLRDPVLLVAIPDGDGGTLALTNAAQETLIAYVERGGTLIFAPRLPVDSGIARLWNSSGTSIAGPNGLRASRHAYGQGAVIEWDQELFPSAALEDAPEDQSTQDNTAQAVQNLPALLERLGATPSAQSRDVSNSGNATPLASPLLFSELVADSPSTGASTPADSCKTRPLCAAALVSLTNLDPRESADANLTVHVPPLYPQTEIGASVVVHATVPAHDSLLLPIRTSLCTTAGAPGECQDEIVYSGAELLGALADDKTLELTFYAPANATVLLRLESRPEKIELDENEMEGSWADGIHLLTVSLLRGAAPNYLRVLKIHLRYKPYVGEKPIAPKQKHSDYEAFVVNATRLPLGRRTSIFTSPALLFLQNEKEDAVILRTVNRGDSTLILNARVDGPEHGAEYVRVGAGATDLTRIRLEATARGGTGPETSPADSGEQEPGTNPVAAGPENHELGRGELTLQSGGAHVAIPLAFADLRANAPLQYQFDFERDGAREWTLESDALRLVFCPRDGGRAVAIVTKVSGENMTSVTGALRDWFVLPGADQPADFTFNRSYDAEWIGSGDKPGLRMKYHAAEAGPAGATIEKNITLVSPDTFQVDYRVGLDSAPPAPTVAGMQFIAASRVPATQSEADGTKLCWSGAPPAQAAQNTNPSPETCVAFEPGGGSGSGSASARQTLPPSVTQLEFRTPGSAGLRVEWTAGAMSLKMEGGDVLLQLALPLGANSPAETVMRYTVFSAP